MVDVTTLTDLISQFRQTTQANSITPETVGSILQKIVDILATAGTQANLDTINSWHEALRTAAPALTSLAQGTADANDVYLATTKVNLYTGLAMPNLQTKIAQATTERAGVMRAQQVVDLNAAKKGVSELSKSVGDIQDLIDTITARLDALGSGGTSSGATTSTIQSQLMCEVVDGNLVVKGSAPFTAKGLVPYLFRHTKRRNRNRNSNPETFGPPTKGWHRMGSRHSVRVVNTIAEFSAAGGATIHRPTTSYTRLPTALLTLHTADGKQYVAWGRSQICMFDSRSNSERMIRLRFAIAYAKPQEPGKSRLEAADIGSNLAEFSVVYDPRLRQWSFSR